MAAVDSAKAEAAIARIRAAGLGDDANLFETVYWGWIRTVQAYRHALPYVDNHPDGYTAASALGVVTYTINHWGPQIPGTPALDNEAVLREDADDEAWHREEDRRMRIEAGEDIV